MYTTLESCTDSTGHDDILVMLDFWAHDYDWYGMFQRLADNAELWEDEAPGKYRGSTGEVPGKPIRMEQG